MMNRINPLHIGALLLVVLLFSLFKLSSAKSDLVEVKAQFKETQELVTKLSGLKSVYADKKSVKKSLSRVLNLSSLRSVNIVQKSRKNGVTLSAASMDKNALNSLMGKLLNGAYQINSFKIKKLSDSKVSFEMEIKW